MEVKELNKEQLEELRFAMIFEDDSKYDVEHQPTDEEVFEKFEDIDFVNDDFGCSFGK